MILFLDFDGVLHPDNVILRSGKPFMPDGSPLFIWAEALIDVVRSYDHNDLQIVLSTSWAHRLGYEYAKSSLPTILSERVVDATWHKDSYQTTGITPRRWWQMNRHQQILHYVKAMGLSQWIAVDNIHEGFSSHYEDNIVRCDSEKGLSCLATQAALSKKIQGMSERPAQPTFQTYVQKIALRKSS